MLPALALRLRVRVLLALLAAAAVCLLATPAVRKFACKIGAMDMPGESRRVHDHPIPRLGGLALFAGFLAGVLPFTGIDEPVQGILLGSVIVVVTGAVDDLVSLRPWVKLVLQIAAAVVAIRHGVVIRILTNPGDASAEAIALGALSVPVTLLWIVGMTNALNLIDGLDGLAAGVCGIGCASMLAVSLFLPQATEISVLVAALGGACLGFLPFNINPAKIFMGDSGSLLLGYVLSTASVLGLFKMYTLVAFAVPVLTLALPLTDTVFAVVRRVSRGESRPWPHPPPAARAGAHAEAGGRRALCRQRHSRRGGGAARGERRDALLAAARCGGARARHMAVCFRGPSFPVQPFGEGAGEGQKRGRQHETVSRPYRSK